MSTFIGKILVIVITCVSLIFLGIIAIDVRDGERLAEGRVGRAIQSRSPQEEAPGCPARNRRRQKGTGRCQSFP